MALKVLLANSIDNGDICCRLVSVWKLSYYVSNHLVEMNDFGVQISISTSTSMIRGANLQSNIQYSDIFC